MIRAPLPPDEQERLAALHALEILDTPEEEALDELVRLAATICGSPIGVISLVDAERQWFKSHIGLDARETSRDVAFCAHAILQDEIFEVRDAAADERFHDNPLVIEAPGIRFYAGATIKTESGHSVGTLCVIDREPRQLDDAQKHALMTIGRAVSAQLALHRRLRQAVVLERERTEAQHQLERTSALLETVSAVQSEFLLTGDPAHAFDRLLSTLLHVTASEFGFIGEVLDDDAGAPFLKIHAITNIAWNEEIRRFYDENVEKGLEFRDLRNLIGAAMTTGRTVISNDPANDPRRGGLPAGHPPLTAFMSVPFYTGRAMSGMVAVANRSGGYSDEIASYLDPLLSTCGSLIGRDRSDRLRRTAEEALRLSEERMRLTVTTALDAVIAIDGLGRVIEWNPRAQEIFGWTFDEAVTRDLGDLIIPERHRAAHRAGMRRFLDTGALRMTGRLVETTAVRKSGEEFPVELSISIVPVAGGMSFNAFLRDITERQRSEQELRTTTSRLSALIRNLHAGLLVEDEHRRVQLANEELCRMFGIPVRPDALLGSDCAAAARDLASLFEEPESFLARIDGILAARELVLAEEIRLNDGRTLERDYVPIIIDAEYRGHMWQYRDVTARIRAQQDLIERRNELGLANAELARAARMKDEFLASMSHELRTPLNAVLGLAEATRVGAFGEVNAEQAESLTTIEDSGRHLLQLINDILDLSKVEAGRMSLSFGEVEVQAICSSSVRLVRDAAYKKNLRLSLSIDADAGVVRADPLRLKQILVNLLSNAVKFTPPGGAIGLDAVSDRAAERMNFTVWDTGIGISVEDATRLFEPFFQVDSSLSREHSGTGLGLPLVHRLAKLHGGGVSIESRPGTGSRFTVALPWSDAAASDPAIAARTPSPEMETSPTGIPGALILLAEDNEVNVSMVERFLRSRGYRISVARDGIEALRRASDEKPAAILMDVQMPKMDGFEAIRQLRNDAATATIPIIALTALAMPDDRERCLAAGADEYLAKPVSLLMLTAIIEKLVAGKTQLSS